MSHFYKPDDATLFECDLRVAKKKGLYPSVTGILGMQDKPNLIHYFKKQAIIACKKYPRLATELDDDKYYNRVIAQSHEDRENAADIGSLVHYWIEQYLTKGLKPFNFIDVPWQSIIFHCFQSVKKWLDDNIKEVIYTEKTFVNKDFEYGCKIDLLAEDNKKNLVLIDFKTQKIKPDDKGRQKPTYYLDSYCSQLTAQYTSMIDDSFTSEPVKLISVVISSIPNVKGKFPVFVKEWDLSERLDGWEIFKACRILHKIKKGI